MRYKDKDTPLLGQTRKLSTPVSIAIGVIVGLLVAKMLSGSVRCQITLLLLA